MKRSHSMPFGAAVVPNGVHFRLWAPAASGVEVGVSIGAHAVEWHSLTAEPEGWYRGIVERAGAGTRYRFRIDGDALEIGRASCRERV